MKNKTIAFGFYFSIVFVLCTVGLLYALSITFNTQNVLFILGFCLIIIGSAIYLHQKFYTTIREIVKQNTTTQTQEKDLQLELLKDRENYRREFLGNVSHELKTPLFSIQGFILTLIEGAVKDKKIRDKYLDRINKSVERLIFIVKDLDVLAEIETGNFNLEKTSFDLKKLVLEVFELLEFKAEGNMVKLFCNSSLANTTIVYADRKRMEQVLINLINNAIFHSNKSDSMVIVGIEDFKNQLKISVKDNGIGIAEKHINRVFERFYRVDAARSRNHGGSGLGLSIVKNILEAHHTKIHLKSVENEGSEFSFLLAKS